MKSPAVLQGARQWGLHPCIWLMAWFVGIVSCRWISWPFLIVALGVFCGLFCRFGFARFIQLCRRSFVLLLTTVGVLAWKTPGVSLWPTDDAVWNSLLPTYEGIALAGEQSVALLVFLSAAALCLTVMTQSQVLVGLYRITAWLPGLDARRLTVRFMLVLEQTSRPSSRISWHRFLALLNTSAIPTEIQDDFVLKEPALRIRDYAAMGMAGVYLFLIGWLNQL